MNSRPERPLCCNPLDDFLVLQSGESRTLLTKQASPPQKHKAPEIDGLGAFMGAVRASYAAVGTTRAALAALAALFFSRLTLAQRFC